MHKRSKLYWLLGISSLLLFGITPAASAINSDQDSVDIMDPHAVLGALAPELLKQTSAEDHVTVVARQNESRITVRDLQSPEGTLIALGVSFHIDHETEMHKVVDGIHVLTGGTDFATYVQPTPSGVRVLTAIASAEAPSEFSYTFDVPKNTDLVEKSHGFRLESGEKVLGTFAKPWALDANGNEVETSFSWNDGVLVQKVNLEQPGIKFPLLLDPNWTYTKTYNIAKAASNAWADLVNCFSCEFPLSGAPTAFPGPFEFMPLRLPIPGVSGLFNFDVRRHTVVTLGPTYYNFTLNADTNHIDGPGSQITFEIENYQAQPRLVVSAFVVNDFWLGNGVYEYGAHISWQSFAFNLGN